MELFLEDHGGKSYLFVPVKDKPGMYAVYGPDGHRLGGPPWLLQKEDMPDPVIDSVNDRRLAQ